VLVLTRTLLLLQLLALPISTSPTQKCRGFTPLFLFHVVFYSFYSIPAYPVKRSIVILRLLTAQLHRRETLFLELAIPDSIHLSRWIPLSSFSGE